MVITYNKKMKNHTANRKTDNLGIGIGILNTNVDQIADKLGSSIVQKSRHLQE